MLLFINPISSGCNQSMHIFCYTIESKLAGTIINMDNRYIARVAKLAGAPKSKSAGVEFLVSIDTVVSKSQPLFKLYAETQAELDYALDFLKQDHEVFQMEVSA